MVRVPSETEQGPGLPKPLTKQGGWSPDLVSLVSWQCRWPDQPGTVSKGMGLESSRDLGCLIPRSGVPSFRDPCTIRWSQKPNPLPSEQSPGTRPSRGT